MSYKEPVPEDILEYVKALCEDVDTAVEHCTPYGKGLKLLSNKPGDRYYAYVWRMARFHCGQDTSFPSLCFYELSDAIEKDFDVRVRFHIIDESRKQLLDLLDNLADEVLKRIGLSTHVAASRWAGILRATT